jgi:hypothetical protein
MGCGKENGAFSVASVAIQQGGICASPKTGASAQLSSFVPFSDTQRIGAPTIFKFNGTTGRVKRVFLTAV